MLPPVLDLKDCELQLWQGGSLTLQSPGYALLKEHQYSFGDSARSAARLHPREVNTRYWWQLGTSPLKPALGTARHTADLAHAHLLDIHLQGGQPDKLVLAAPGTMGRNQLALLLGIIEQCPFEAVGLVNRSTAVASVQACRGPLLHLELQLHQAALTRLVVDAGTVSVDQVLPLPGCGLLHLQERLVEVIASAFIRQTRFDPRRSAATEQALYEALPGTLAKLKLANETNVELNGYRARIVAQQLSETGRRLLDSVEQVVNDSDEMVLVDPIFDLLPNIIPSIPRAKLLDDRALIDALQQQYSNGEHNIVQQQQQLHFIQNLPTLAGDDPPAASASHQRVNTDNVAPKAQPTHLLCASIARPLDTTINGSGWTLAVDAAGWKISGAVPPQVNGQIYTEGNYLAVGDQILMGNGDIAVLIEVQS